MSNHIEKLYEYDRSRLLDLMAGMADLGIETDQGWIFQWESTTENPLVEFVIASHPREALEIYEKNGWFGPDIAAVIKSGKQFETLRDVFNYLAGTDLIFNSQIIYGLTPKKGVEKQYGYITRSNPFAIVDKLNQVFENGAQRYSTLTKTDIK
jgi:hypothetical protein